MCGLSQKPTPLIVATAPSCFQEFVAFPQAASNFLRALMIALRARAFLGCRRHLRDPVSAGVEQDQMNVAIAFAFELDDLNCQPPNLKLERRVPCRRRWVRMIWTRDLGQRCVLRRQVDLLAQRITKGLQRSVVGAASNRSGGRPRTRIDDLSVEARTPSAASPTTAPITRSFILICSSIRPKVLLPSL